MRFRKILITVSILICVLALFSLASVNTDRGVIYGPENFDNETGGPISFERKIIVEYEVRDGILHIENGKQIREKLDPEPNKPWMISNRKHGWFSNLFTKCKNFILYIINSRLSREKAVKGIIKLNGQVIANEKQFNHFIDTIDIPVKLLDGENLLEISFIGSKHAGITAYLDAVPVLDVNLQAEPQTGYTPLAVNLKATVNPGAKVSGYQWDFNNDGIIDQETTEAQTSYVYRQPGSYEPRVIVTHVCGLQVNGATGPIQVDRLLFNVKLESQPLSGLAPLTVAFTATIDQAQIQPVTYDWDFNNDGVIDQTTTTGNTTHTYQEAGTYRAKVAVTDVVGTMAEATTPVITVYQLSVPANFQAVPGPYKITLFWDPVDQATGYELEIDGAVVDTGGQVSYTYRDVTPNVRHSFRVRAKNANGTSLWSEAIFSSTEPLSFNCRVDAQPLEGLVPLIVTFTAAIDNPEVEPASYAWDFDNDGVTDQTTTEGNASYKYQNARIYRAKVVVTDIAGTTGAGTSQPITVYDLAVPENVRATAGDYIVTISWDAVTHATGYDLEADGVVIDTEGKTTYKYRATTPGQQHEFRVRAKNGGTTGLWSAKVYGSSLGWLVRSSMPTARGYGSLAAAAVNNKIYAIGGSNGTSLSTVEEYDPFTNSWLTKKPMNTARYGLALTELNGKLYAIGGISSSYLNTMEEYDPATDTWKAKASMKNTRYSFGAAVVNGKIYAVGGSNGSTRYNSMEEYDPKANSWTAKASMVTARLNHGVAAVNGKIYVIGGNNGSAVINTVEEYNPATDTWTYKANMPTARQAFGVTVVDNKIYVIGGYNGSAYLNTVEEYDPATDTWKTRLNMMTPRNGLGAASVNGRIFAIGGYNGSNLNRVEEYNLKLYELPAPVNVKAEAINYSTITVNWDTVFGASGYDLEVDGTIINLGASTSYTHRDLLPDIVHTYRVRSKNNTGISEWVTVYEWIYSWKVKADLPTARYYLGAAAWNNKVYAIGGSNGVALGTVEEYDIVTDTWTSKASLKTARYGAGVEAINGKIYAAGGMGSSYLTSLEEFNPATNTWTTKASMKTARSNAGVAVLNGRLYVVGGYNSTNGYLSTVEEYDPETDTWATKASLKAGRNYLGVAAVNGKLYAIGGYNGSYLNTVEEYDPVANTWTTKSALPTARYAWVEVADNKIYAIGGYNGNYLNTMEEYNPVTDTWTTSKLPMPTARNGFGITATNGKIYIIGGTNGSGLNRVEEFTWEQFDLWAPTNVLAKITDPYTIAVSWDSVLGATSYDIEIDGAIIDAGNNTTYVHSSLTRDILHTYRVRAKNGNRLSDWTTVYKCIASWKVKADLPTARYYLGATAWNNKVYAVGGTNGSALATVEEYDIVTNTWTSKASLKTARYGAGVEAINGKIYAVGGMSSSSSYFNTLEEYDPATNSWTSKASMKTARSNAGVGVLNGRLYVVGGYNSTNGYLSIVEEYDPETDTWATKASLKAGRNYLGVAAVNGKLYAIGGYNGSYLNTVEEYDPVANTWTTKSVMPTARYTWVEAVNNKIYAIGGYNTSGYLNMMEEYDPATDTWTTAKLPMPTARSAFGIVTTNGKIYAIGGYNGTALNRIEEFTWEQFDLWAPTNVMAKTTDPYTITVGWDSVVGVTGYDIEVDGTIIDVGNNTMYVHSGLTRDILHTYRVRAKNGNRLSDWTTVYKCIASWKVKANLPAARYYLGAAAWNNKVYAVGGTNGSALATVEEYDIVTNTWTSKASLKTARYGVGVEAINGKIYAVGGMSSSSSYLTTLEEYNPATNSWTTKASMKTTRSNVGVGVLNGRLYVVGGYNSTNGYLSTVEEYDPETDTWATKASLKAGRNYLGVAAVNGKLYAIGGYNGSYINTVEEYDPVANTWTTKTAMPTARYTWVEAANNKIYAIGGYNGSYLTTVEEYNPATDTWTTTKLPMPTARSAFGIVTTNGKLYAIGGYNGTALDRVEEFTWEQFDLWAPTNVTATITNLNTITIEWDSVTGATGYDIEVDGTVIDNGGKTTYSHTGLTRDIPHIYRVRGKNGKTTSDWTTVYRGIASWKYIANLPVAKYQPGSAAFNNKIYIIGGYTTTYVATVDEYDPEANTWTAKAALKTARYGLGAVLLDNKIYAIGGRSSAYLNTVEEYDPVSNSWTTKANLKNIRYLPGVATVNGKIYAIGGYTGSSSLNTVEEYDPLANTWTLKANMKTARYGLSAVVVNGKIYAIGGYNGSAYQNIVEEYDPIANTWTTKTSMPTARAYFGAEMVDDKLYVIGGYNGSYLNMVEEYDPATDSWRIKPNMPTPRDYLTATALRGRIYAIGGYNGAALNRIEEFTVNPEKILDEPANLTATASGLTRITLSWDPVPGATEYEIEVDGVLVSNGADTTYNHDGQTPGSLHNYRVRAKNAVGTSEWSYISKVTLPDKPANLIAIPGETTITLSWDAVNGATGYEVEADGKVLSNSNQTVFLDLGLESGTSHSYKVRAKNTSGVGEWSDTITKVTLPGVPDNIRLTAAETSITVVWNPVSGATGYDIEVDGAVNDNSLAMVYLHSGLEPGTDHTYRVRSKNESGPGNWSAKLVKSTIAATPSNVTASATDTVITVTWDTVTGATSYDIEVDQTLINIGLKTTYQHSGLLPGTTHAYRVRANNTSGMGNWSAEIGKTTIPGIPVNLKTKSVDTTITVTWDAVMGADGYDIEVDGLLIDNANRTSYVHNGVLPDSYHGYRVRARNGSGVSDWAVSASKPFNVTLNASPSQGVAPAAVTFTAVVDLSQVRPVSYDWDFNGDGTIDQTTTNATTTYTYTQAKTYWARVTVTDIFTTKSSATSDTIQVDSPVITFQASAYPDEGPAPFTVLFYSGATSTAGPVTNFYWDFDNNGTYDWQAGVVGSTTYTYTKPGLYKARFAVSDDKGNTAEKIYLINVTGAPETSYIQYYVTPDNGGAPLTVKFGAKATIPNREVTEYEIDYEGDGTYDWSMENSWTNVLTQDAEFGLQGWTTEGTWGIIDTDYLSPALCFTDSPGGNYANNTNYSLISPEIDLTNFFAPYLEFYHKYSVENYYDFGVVEVSKDGGATWKSLKSYTGGSVANWNYEKLLLTEYEGAKIKIRFRLHSDGSNIYDGWYLDDIRVNCEGIYWSHVYNQPGVYEPTLKVTDSNGGTYSQTRKVNVSSSGTPSAIATADKAKGPAPLLVNFTGKGTTVNGGIDLYQWDLNGDGIYEWSSTVTGDTSFTYNEPGIYDARLQVTDSSGMTSETTVKIEVDLQITLVSIPESFNPEQGQTADVTYSLNGEAKIQLLLIKRDGTVIRTLTNWETRPKGTNTATWDGRDKDGNIPPSDVYCVVIKAIVPDGRQYVLNLTGQVENIGNPTPIFPAQFAPFKNQFCTISWYMPKKGLATVYIGYAYGNRIRTLVSQKPYTAGNHTLVWDGTTEAGLLCPLNTTYFIGTFAEAFPVNGMILEVNQPQITSMAVSPNYYNAEYNAYQAVPGMNTSEFTVNFSVPSQITVTIRDSQGRDIKVLTNDQYKTDHVLTWDGLDGAGQKQKPGIYIAEIKGKSAEGHQSDPGRVVMVIFY